MLESIAAVRRIPVPTLHRIHVGYAYKKHLTFYRTYHWGVRFGIPPSRPFFSMLGGGRLFLLGGTCLPVPLYFAHCFKPTLMRAFCCGLDLKVTF